MLGLRSWRSCILILAGALTASVLAPSLGLQGEASASPSQASSKAHAHAGSKSSKKKPARAKGKPEKKRAKPKLAKARSAEQPSETRFLGKNPHGPLAIVKDNRIDTPASGACRTWGPKGSTWSALDALGQIVGKAKVSALDRYDVTNCDELTMKRTSGEKGAGIYVQGQYDPAALTSWAIEASALAELRALIASRDRLLPASSQKEKDLALDRRVLAWKQRGVGFAVVGGRGLTVLRRDGGGWKVVDRLVPAQGEVAHADMFMPLAALDMNRDGKLEIVVHRRFLDSYDDFTLTPEGAAFREVIAGIHGAFA